jgi:hypothetical protein
MQFIFIHVFIEFCERMEEYRRRDAVCPTRSTGYEDSNEVRFCVLVVRFL